MRKMWLVDAKAMKSHKASRALWLELDYLRTVLKDCERYNRELWDCINDLGSSCNDSWDLAYDGAVQDYQSSIKMLLWYAKRRGCSEWALQEIEAWL